MNQQLSAPGDSGPESQPEGAVNGHSQSPGALQSRNVRIHSRRTSVRLEPEMWSALNEIAKLEHCSIHDLCGAVHDLKDPATSFTAALRVFLMEYYRAAAKASTQVTQVQKRIKNRDKPADGKLAAEG
jgi:predicted DNA-binding ribbon-helix-helix protein